MNTTGMPGSLLLRTYALEARYEFTRLLRSPSFSIPTLLFPALFYLLFGVLLNRGNANAAEYLLATYGVFGVMGVGLFGFGVTVAMERQNGLLTWKRALPMPAGAWLTAKMAMAALFSAGVSLLLGAIAAAFAGVDLSAGQWLALLAVNLAGVLPFCALGLWMGSLLGAQGAPVVINLIYLPMAFLSGLWLPLTMLPGLIGTLAPVWPAWHLAQLALKVVGQDAGHPPWLHLGVLLVVTMVFSLLAWRRLSRAA